MKKLFYFFLFFIGTLTNLFSVPYTNGDKVYYSREEFINILEDYGYNEAIAKQFENYIYNNCIREFFVDDESIIDTAAKYQKTYISTYYYTNIESYSILYICKKGKIYCFPVPNNFEVIKASDTEQYQYNFYKRNELISYFIWLGISPENAILFEKKIYDSIYEVNYYLNPVVRDTMHRYNVEYSIPVVEISHKPIGIINTRHGDLFSTVVLQYVYESCFPEQLKSFYDNQLRWYTLCNLEGVTFKLYNSGLDSKELILDMKYMKKNLDSKHIADNFLIRNQLESSNYEFALVDEPDNSGWNIYYKVNDEIYTFSSREFLSK